MGRHHLDPASAGQPTERLVVTVPADPSEPARITQEPSSLTPAPTPEAPAELAAQPAEPASTASSSTASPGLTSTQPVALTSVVQALLAAAVSGGWVVLDSATVATAASAVAGVIWLVLTLFTRSKVTPVARPRDAQGQPLTPNTKEAA